MSVCRFEVLSHEVVPASVYESVVSGVGVVCSVSGVCGVADAVRCVGMVRLTLGGLCCGVGGAMYLLRRCGGCYDRELSN